MFPGREAATLAAVLLGLLLPAAAHAQDDGAELAKKLANPVANLISVPLQNNYDCCYGPEDGYRYTLNVQPVVPISLNEDWNLIVRTIVPIVYQEAPTAAADNEFGFSDVTQSFFFSPSKPKNGLTWAIGPVFTYPLGDAALGSEKWGAGPTVLVLKQDGPLTFGILANHVWSYAGDSHRGAIVQTFLQPFFNYTRPDSTSFLLNTESTYNWKTEQWTVPVIFGVSHVYKFGQQRVSLGAQGKVYLAHETDGPEWGLRFVATFLFPK